jgi:uncharacterized protein (DUF433 family)
MFLSFSELG